MYKKTVHPSLVTLGLQWHTNLCDHNDMVSTQLSQLVDTRSSLLLKVALECEDAHCENPKHC